MTWTTSSTAVSALADQARRFAEEVRDLLSETVCESPVLELEEMSSRERLSVVIRSSKNAPPLLTVDSRPILKLEVSYRLCLAKDMRYLRTDQSTFQVRSMAKGAPLFRYDYLASPQSSAVPSAHFQVHAHRDELLHAMYVSDRACSRPAQRKDLDPASPRGLQMIHFPLGGARFRPCLEDVIELLINEFGVDAQPGWQNAIRCGRIAWRHIQLAAAVRDDPETARSALQELTQDAPTAEDRLTRI